MTLIYTTQATDLPGRYRNPRYFDQVEPAEKVIVIGDWPEVVAAYEAAGVPVETPGKPKRSRKRKD